MARLVPYSGRHSPMGVQKPFGFETEGALSAKLQRVQEKTLLSIGETPNSRVATMGIAKELPAMTRTNAGIGSHAMVSVSSKHSSKHSQSEPTIGGSSAERKMSSGSIQSPWATEQGSGWSRMRGARSSYPGQPPGVDAMTFRETLKRPGPGNYAIGTFDSSFEID